MGCPDNMKRRNSKNYNKLVDELMPEIETIVTNTLKSKCSTMTVNSNITYVFRSTTLVYNLDVSLN